MSNIRMMREYAICIVCMNVYINVVVAATIILWWLITHSSLLPLSLSHLSICH